MTDTANSHEPRYRLLFEHNLAGVYCTTFDGAILDCNESMAAMLGYTSREELLAHKAPDLYLQHGDRKAFLDRLRADGVLTNSELRLRRKDGTAIDILENVILIPDPDGQGEIIQGTMVDISERKRAEEALRESERRYRRLAADLRRLMQRMHTVREEERGRIARELHDELGQSLTALNMDLHWLQGRSWQDSEITNARLTSMLGLLDATIRSIRRICADLRPAVLDDFGLTAAIEWQAQEFQARTGIRCNVEMPVDMPQMPNEQATAVFRIFQESLTNIVRHAGATEATVTLNAEGDTLILTVADNGSGISPEDASGSHALGLAGMRERALRWGGQLEITGTDHEGTTIVLHMPVEKSANGGRL